ncbi:YlqD family protein [Alkalibacillus haloalkaliphilus]|uniref:YlqD family protein n=1 Tax=Alkalibacillus haloalkaliphilus TaxID=94136 RepID=UPI0002E0D596|nr:YlqD family protein [Alkalibacillus haloalkaliphilus]
MQIIRKTTVKQVVTEDSKQKLVEQFQEQVAAKQKEIEQLNFEKKKLIYKQKFDQHKVEEKFSQEELKRKQSIEWYELQIEQLDQLPLGSEITEKEVDEIVEVSVGDAYDELFGDREIVVEDGIIVRINR